MSNNKSEIRMEYLSAKSFTKCSCNDQREIRISEKFINLAMFLNPKEVIGWQIKMPRKAAPENYLFTSSNSNVFVDDFNWIFKDYAKVIPDKSIIVDKLLQDEQKNYELLYLKDIRETGEKTLLSEDNIAYGESIIREEYFYEMCREMGMIGASINIIAGLNDTADKVIRKIIFSFPKQIPLRIKTLISIIFPNTVLQEKTEASKEGILPMYHFQRYIIKLLEILGNEQKNVSDESYNKKYYKESIELTEVNQNDSINKQSIYDLEFGSRIYNCLRRAGITTIEQLYRMTDEDLYKIRNLGKRGVFAIKRKLAEMQEEMPNCLNKAQIEESNYIERLEALIGIQAAKEQVKQIIAFAKLQKDICLHGRKLLPVTLNMKFIGNPGTAKTTVARIMAGLFSEIGLTEAKGLIEVGRADLIANYEGQTAGKVKAVFEKAKGKVLFIDEAYSLVEYTKGAYGDEAINTIVQEMENNRENTIVIFAGYPDKMKEFFLRNPGLRSRVPFTIKFDDYSAEELVGICEFEAEKRGFEIDCNARKKIQEICNKAAGNADMGNGRFCRNLIEKAILAFAVRIYKTEVANEAEDYTLTAEDFGAANINFKEKTVSIGFKV